MITLHIEHAITDLATWSAAFDAFEGARRDAGVRSHRVSQPVHDARYVLVDLDFDTVEAATAFRDFLVHTVWAVPQNSPALAGTPETSILQLVGAAAG